MYADGSLDLEEDARLNRVLTAMGVETEYDRDRVLDETITRLREYSQTPQLARDSTPIQLAQSFYRPRRAVPRSCIN